MTHYAEIDIKSSMPTVNEAMSDLKAYLECRKKSGFQCILVIHGYGSTGKGGAIRVKARQWLNAQLKNHKVKSVIYGEDFNIFNFEALKLKNKYPELKHLLDVCNHGVTVVEL